MSKVPERWIKMGAQAIIDETWDEDDWVLWTDESKFVLDVVLADLRHQIGGLRGITPSSYWDDAIDEVLHLLNTGGSDA